MSDVADLARAAFADGWARSQGPLTDRVKAGCTIAVALACEHADQPGILEATLRLGSLEGTWAAVHDRREQLYTHHIAAVTVAYRALTADCDIAGGVRRFRRSLGLAETAVDDRRRETEAAAAVEATRILHQAFITPSSPEYQATVDSIAGALLDAEAEGTAGGIAIAAEQAGRIGVYFDLAFRDARDALGRLGEHWADAKGWLGRVVDGNATDLGAALARVAADGGSYEEMLTAAQDVIGGEDIRAVSTIVDLAMGQSYSRGALTLYGREGVTTVDFITAGSRVCPICLSVEAGNPWRTGEVAAPPRHPNCRCVLAPSSDSILTLSADLDRYFAAA